jgi:hypothetical protein
MGKEIKILILLLVIVIVSIFYSSKNDREKLNWFESYYQDHKIPFGTYVLFNELENLYQDSEIETVNDPPYEFMNKNQDKGLYIFINENIAPDEKEILKMKEFVSKGNDIFISSHSILFDTLGFETRFFVSSKFDDTCVFSLSNTSLAGENFWFDRPASYSVLKKIDTLNSVVLGESSFRQNLKTLSGINFVKFKYGKGNFYFHTVPEVFTNYFILDSLNFKYTLGILSHLGQPENIYWDSYYKNGKNKNISAFSYVLNKDSLRWAFYFLLFGVLVFVFFESKRKQRIIPVIEAVKNQTLEFARTVSDMYYDKSNHKKILEMRNKYFLDYIRHQLHVETDSMDEEFFQIVSERSGNPVDKTITLFRKLEELNSKKMVTKQELIEADKLIDNYKSKL